MTVLDPAPALTDAGAPPFARGPVLGVAGAVAVLLLACSPFYGHFGDELYFVEAGRHLQWGYADQPPVLPLLAAGLDALAPGSTVVLRLPAVLAVAGIAVLAALIARELGGHTRAQVTAAGAVAASWFLLASGRLLATSTLDPFWWALLLWLLVRWIHAATGVPRGSSAALRAAPDRLLVVAGVVLAVALNTKFLVLGLVLGVGVGVLVAGPRRLLTRPMLWLGLAIAALATVPTLVWQATHGWPQLQMGGVVTGEADLFGNRWQFLPVAVLFAGVLPGVVLVLVGLVALLRRPELRPWRGLGVAVLVTTAAFVVAGGRPYYVAGLYALLFAAGAVALEQRPAQRWWRWTTGPVALVVCGVATAVLVLPIGPASAKAQTDFTTMGQLGWPELAAGVGERYDALPPDVRAETVVIASSYWDASALAYHREAAGLPAVYSPHRGYYDLGVPPGSAPALVVGELGAGRGACATYTPLPPYLAPEPTPVLNTVPLALCTPRAPWATVWPGLRSMA
ncbi:glycosyl transferase family 39 [Actinomycetospora sp. NBRC 106375]|uniref:glycosyltransferase family 39 protein n=1 Tax=Actinomycetospora sp. NBRC 106375 TaxID=3032207 RepID=UPI0024A1770D|nr:glycosyltransferase family 39 protein [Actinomycetospora sp. NBRC 106375]GLZ49208.1 glycosyl transferase family 39 [Actinomycetospora sp. NBRC 106375]